MNIFSFNPRPKNSTTGDIESKYNNRGYAEPATAEQVRKLLGREDLPEMLRQIREDGREDVKEKLPYICPHYSVFRNNHRSQADIIPEAFTFRTCIDIDDLQMVSQAINRAKEVNADEMSDWQGMVEYIDLSARKKCHIWIRIPVGKTIEEAQRDFCKEIDVPFDESCITPERYIYMTGDTVYMSDNWLKPLTDEEIEERREAFLQRGLDVDGRPLKKPAKETVSGEKLLIEFSKVRTEMIPANKRTRYIFDECMREAGLQSRDFTDEGGRHNAVKSVLSVGADKLLSESEFTGVLHSIMGSYSQSDDIRRLISDYYMKYNDPTQKLTQFQRRVFAQSRRMSANVETASVSNAADGGTEKTVCNLVYGDTATLSEIYSSPFPPSLSPTLPKLVKAVTSPTPVDMKPTVAQGMFPALGAYPRDLKCLYIDNQYRELRMNCLTIGGTGNGKDSSLKQPLKHITANMVKRDAVNRQRLKEFNEQYNSTKQTKDKPKRPADLIIQKVGSDITQARLAQLMDDSQGATLYTQMNEFDQWFGVEGCKPGTNCTFKNLKLADDEDNPFGQERAGAQSVNYQGPLNINWNSSTTPNKAQLYFRNAMNDGPISRLCLATTPDRGIGAPIPKHGNYGEKYDEALMPFIENLEKATGEIDCKQARKLVERLKEELDEFSILTQDEVLDNLGHRALVHAFRKACLIYVANGMKWEKAIEGFCRWSLHYDLWLKMHFFGDQIRNADRQIQTSHRGPRNLLEMLPEEFTLQDLIDVRLQNSLKEDGARNQLSQWKSRKYILQMTDDRYKKA